MVMEALPKMMYQPMRMELEVDERYHSKLDKYRFPIIYYHHHRYHYYLHHHYHYSIIINGPCKGKSEQGIKQGT